MKPIKFVVLIIFSLFYFFANSQDLQLKISGSDSIEQKVIDSIYVTTKFKNFKNLKTKLDSLVITLQKIGFIETEIQNQERISDSIFEAKIDLNNKFYTIYIYNHQNIVNNSILERISETFTEDYFLVKIPNIESSLKAINKSLIENGNPFSDILELM